MLRCSGIDAESLEGGNFAWRDADLPLVPASVIPGSANGSTLWVTRHRSKVDRVACAWLIRRFIDRHARFLFVSAGQVKAVAERYGATPFDCDDVLFSHRGDKCTFDTMVEEFSLAIPALQQLAVIVRGADTDHHDLAPQCAGLLAASLGLSRLYRDDVKQIEAGMTLYDALYLWARDAGGERHAWNHPAHRSGEHGA